MERFPFLLPYNNTLIRKLTMFEEFAPNYNWSAGFSGGSSSQQGGGLFNFQKRLQIKHAELSNSGLNWFFIGIMCLVPAVLYYRWSNKQTRIEKEKLDHLMIRPHAQTYPGGMGANYALF